MSVRSDNARFLSTATGGILLGSLLIAAWAWWSNPIINPDGAKYLLAAELFSRGEFGNGYLAYKWPFYPLVIALVHFVTGLSLETAAHLFNAAMRGLAGIAFLRLVLLFGGGKPHLLLATLVYLAYPGLNEVQSMVIRDFGYLACFMWMVFFFLRQLTQPTIGTFVGFVGMGALATAFRIEGLVFTTGLLVLYFFLGSVSRFWKKTGLILVVLSLPLQIYLELMWLSNGDLGQAWRMLTAVFNPLGEGVAANRADTGGWSVALAHGMAQLADYAALLGKLLFNTLKVLTVGYLIVLLSGWFLRPLLDPSRAQVPRLYNGWRWIVAINLLILIGFVLLRAIFTDRYPLSLALLLMLFMPFAIVRLLEWSRTLSHKGAVLLKAALIIALGLNTLEGLDRFGTKHHLKAAGMWLQARNPEGEIYTNNRVIDYYSGSKVVRGDAYYGWDSVLQLTQNTPWQSFALMAIYSPRDQVSHRLDYLRTLTGRDPDRVFEGRRGSRVLVYDFTPP